MKEKFEEIRSYIRSPSHRIYRSIKGWFRKFIPYEHSRQSPSKVPKSAVFFTIIFIILISFIQKYPSGGIQGGIDSFVHHGMAQTILDNGRITWSRSIFSLFGMYPVSLNTGVHTLIASYSSTASTNIFYLTTPYSFILSVVAILGMFMAAREFKKDVRFALLASFVYTCTTRYLFYTNHQVGTRGLFLTLVPLFLWALFRFLDNMNIRNFGFVLLFAFITLATHRMGWFILVMVFALTIGIIIHRFTIPLFWASKNSSIFLNAIIFILGVGIVIIAFVFIDIITIQMVWSRTPEAFIFGDGIVSYVIALVYNYAKYTGVFSIFIPIGFILILFKDKRNIKETVLLVIIISLMFMVGGFLYLAPVLFGLSSFLIAYSLVFYRDRIKRKRLAEIAVLLMMIVAVVFPNILLYEDIDGRYPYWIGEDSIEAGLYLSGSPYSGVGDYVYARRLDVFTEEAYGYRLERGYGSVDRYDFSTVRLKPISSLIRSPHDPFNIDDWYWGDTGRVWRIDNWIYNSSIDEPIVRDWMDAHNLRHFIVNSNFERRSLRLTEEQIRDRGIDHSVVHHRYRIFDNNGVSIYWV